MIMTPQEKAAAYDKAIERTRRMIEDYKNRGLDNYLAYAKENIDYIFPELKESEDEKTRKSIISFLRSKNGYMTPDEDWDFHNRWLPWLEKQGQVKESLISQHEKKTCKENDDSLTSENERIIEIIRSTLESYNRGIICGSLNMKDYTDCLVWLEKQAEQRPTIFIPKFRVGDKLVSTKNPRLTYEVLEVGHINELGNPEYKVEIFTDGKVSNPRNIHDMECYKVDEWAKLIEQKAYVVTRCEEHSDYVEEVFFNEDKAQEYCDQFKGNENEYARHITKVKVTL